MPGRQASCIHIVVLAGLALQGASAQDLSVTVLDFATEQPLGSADVSLVCGGVLIGLETTDSLGRAVFAHPVDTDREPVPDRGFSLAPPYPNPAVRRARALLRVDQEAALALGLFDVLGRKVLALTTWVRPGTHTVEMELGGLPAGTYFLRADRGGGHASAVALVKWGAEAGVRAVRLAGASPEKLPDPVSKTWSVGQLCQVHVSRAGYRETIREVRLPGVDQVAIPLAMGSGEDLITPLGMRLTRVRAGIFEAGSMPPEPWALPRHSTAICQDFYLGAFEVTQQQYALVMQDNPSQFPGCGADCPVEGVAWQAAQAFIERLNEVEGTSRYRLPTEEEWEYAARAGTVTEYSFGDDPGASGTYAWFAANSDGLPHPVARKRANPWGLFDMHGNASEWVVGSFQQVPNGPWSLSDPWERARDKILRGGGWDSAADEIRSASREGIFDGLPHTTAGFRVYRALDAGQGPTLSVERCGAEFGFVEEGKSRERTVTLSNSGTGTLSGTVDEGEGLAGNGFAVVWGGGPFSLAPGETRVVGISFAPESTGVKHARLEVAHDASNTVSPLQILLTGEGVAARNPDDTNTAGMGFRRVSNGSFEMGSPIDAEARPLHEVTLTHDFYIGITEVTHQQWEEVMETEAPDFGSCRHADLQECPVPAASWMSAIGFANALSGREGLAPCYDDVGNVIGDSTGNVYQCEGYRLPTEAEWEYATRAGTTTEYAFGEEYPPTTLGDFAWYLPNAYGSTYPVAAKRPNPWGLFDTYGNTWEWVNDWGGTYPAEAQTDPLGPSEGSCRVQRGGNVFSPADQVGSSTRSCSSSQLVGTPTGFRLVRSIAPE